MKNRKVKRSLPFFAALIMIGLVLLIELILGNRNAVLACLIVGALYALLALPLSWIASKIVPRDEKWVRPENPMGEFLNGDWIRARGEKKWVLRFLLQLLPVPLLVGFAAWKIFSDGRPNLESLLVFLAWALTALGISGVLIYRSLKERRQQEWEEAAAENGEPDVGKRLEQIETYYHSGLIDKKEARAMREEMRNKSAERF